MAIEEVNSSNNLTKIIMEDVVATETTPELEVKVETKE